MRPPILNETTIRAAIYEIAGEQGGRVSGVAVRKLLAERFGARGGVDRVYRLLNEFRGAARGQGTEKPRASTAAHLTGETLADAITRADLAEHRERVHQERWAREIDELRARLAAAEQAARDADLAKRRVAELTRALASAQARIAALEQAQPG